MWQEDHNNTHPRVALIAGGLSTGLALIILSGLATILLLNRHYVAVRSKLHADLMPLRQLGLLSSLDPLDITMQFEQQHLWLGQVSRATQGFNEDEVLGKFGSLRNRMSTALEFLLWSSGLACGRPALVHNEIAAQVFVIDCYCSIPTTTTTITKDL